MSDRKQKKKRHPNHRRIKIHRNYAVEEVADVLGVHKNTVREWIRQGLPTTDDKRPMLILGSDLVVFLKSRRAKNKRPCRTGELYCVRCRAPKSPAGNMVDYEPVAETVGKVTAMCPDCGLIINQRVSLAKLGLFPSDLDIRMPQVPRHVVETA